MCERKKDIESKREKERERERKGGRERERERERARERERERDTHTETHISLRNSRPRVISLELPRSLMRFNICIAAPPFSL